MNSIDIYIITYNRLALLKRTISFLLDDNSPVKNYEITIIDNASNDGTYEYVSELCNQYTNLKCIKNTRNIGGNANICRAYETSLSGKADYVWVLCDDDFYDFSSWNEVEAAIDRKDDVICVSNYALSADYYKKEINSELFELLLQMTFVPSGIYKKSLISDNVLTNMYESIFTMFQQLVLLIEAVNTKKKIAIVSKEIVHNGIFFNEPDKTDYSYNRGVKNIIGRKKVGTWCLGFSNILSLLDDKKIQIMAMENAMNSKCIFFTGIHEFYERELVHYIINDNENYIYEIRKMVGSDLQKTIDDNLARIKGDRILQTHISFIKIAQIVKDSIKKHFPLLFKFLRKVKNKIYRFF